MPRRHHEILRHGAQVSCRQCEALGDHLREDALSSPKWPMQQRVSIFWRGVDMESKYMRESHWIPVLVSKCQQGLQTCKLGGTKTEARLTTQRILTLKELCEARAAQIAL